MEGARSRIGLTRKWTVAIATVSLFAVVALALGVGQSLAAWKVSRAGTGSFSVGSFSFQLSDASGEGASPSNPESQNPPEYVFEQLSGNLDALLPGSIGVAQMLITNTGSTPLTLSYTEVSSSARTPAEEAFSGALSMGALARESEGCQKTDFELADLVKLQAVSSEAPFEVISGEDPLAPGDSRFLCMAVALSADVPPEAQGQKATFLIKVRADQYRRAA